MSKRNIKKRVFHDAVVELQPEDEPVKKRRHPNKKKHGYGYESDDSFEYGETRKTKKDEKHEKLKQKIAHKADRHNGDAVVPPIEVADKKKKAHVPVPKEEVRVIESANAQYVVKFLDNRKPKIQKQRKIFNPQEYIQHLTQKSQLQSRLQQLYDTYGRIVHKPPEPKTIISSWDHLLKHIQQVGKQRMTEREQRVKHLKKVARYAQMTSNRMESLHEQKEKEEEKKVRRTATAVWKLVQKDYWRNVIRVNRYLDGEQRKKEEKEEQTKKLQQLVEKQLEVSNKISQMMEGIDQVRLSGLEVSNVVFPPIVINLKKNPYEFAGLEEDKTIRQPLLIKHTLREYQLLGMHWIYTLHNRRMNGILADEMGLGKTIQTIAFLAHLALSKGVWGPHLVIVPTSIIINWEIEFKRWCPAFKIMTYFGSPKQRKLKRKGWSKLNSFHVCITSYKIVVTDQAIFKRKKWYYMVLDEAQHIKNYKSQRWQTLLNFNAKYRLLLTGTPLQNDISELWSLLHFLRPSLFTSFQDFNEWFNIPFQQALEKNFPISQEILRKLHTVLRPFFLRRLKKDVQKQLPHKTQVIIRCPLSRRQKYLYDEFISHQSKKNPEILGMMNILMQLKKVCNHPDLFLPRVQQTPFNWPLITFVVANHVVLSPRAIPGLYTVYQPKVRYEELAEQVIIEFENIRCNKFSFEYHSQKYRTRLHFMRINYERSKRLEFGVNRVYGEGLRDSVQLAPRRKRLRANKQGEEQQGDRMQVQVEDDDQDFILEDQKCRLPIRTIEQRLKEFEVVFENFLFCVPKVTARTPKLILSQFSSNFHTQQYHLEQHCGTIQTLLSPFYPVLSQLKLHFPEKNILLYDSGKLVKMVGLLKNIKQRGQKVLIFTQMTKMLDIFEKIMNMNKFNYVRLDGGTKTEMRQQLVERFNNDPRVLCFISSTRSGGIGLNLTGASNVIFYDTDWNPAMDKQAQDRCHRIGQTRNVTIYRLISQHTIQQNILIKSIQKRRLDQLVTQDGMFNTHYFQKVNIRDMLQGVIGNGQVLEADLAEVQDNQDRQMLHQAERQGRENVNEFVRDEAVEVEMFPDLFKFGLKMVGMGIEGLEESEEEEGDAEDAEEEVENQNQAEISGEKEGERDSPQATMEKEQKEEEEEDQPNSMKVSDFQRYSGIILYQKHYNFLKKNFYQNNGSNNVPSVNGNIEDNANNGHINEE